MKIHSPFYTSSSPGRATHECSCVPGISLANLPGNVLLRIAWPFKVREWAKGPAQTCHKLYRMQLPRVVVEDPGEKVGPPSSPAKRFLLES